MAGALLPNPHSRTYAEWAKSCVFTHAGRLALAGEIVGAFAHEISQPLSAILISLIQPVARKRLVTVRSSLDPALRPITAIPSIWNKCC